MYGLQPKDQVWEPNPGVLPQATMCMPFRQNPDLGVRLPSPSHLAAIFLPLLLATRRSLLLGYADGVAVALEEGVFAGVVEVGCDHLGTHLFASDLGDPAELLLGLCRIA